VRPWRPTDWLFARLAPSHRSGPACAAPAAVGCGRV